MYSYSSNELACDNPCKTCRGPGQGNCLSCYDDKVLDEHQCLQICTPNKIDYEGICYGILNFNNRFP